MLGWGIVIYSKQGTGRFGDEHRIAYWDSGIRGTEWLQELADEGLATLVAANGGYPLYYVGKAKNILPFLDSPPPEPKGPIVVGDDYAMDANWRGRITVDDSLVAECLRTNEEIVIEAWDLS